MRKGEGPGKRPPLRLACNDGLLWLHPNLTKPTVVPQQQGMVRPACCCLDNKALLDAATLHRVATVSLTGNTHTVMPSGFTVYRWLCGLKIKPYRAGARENMYNRECQIRMAWLLWKHKSEARLVIAIEKQNTGYITFTGVLELLRIVFNWLNTLRCSQDYMRNSV